MGDIGNPILGAAGLICAIMAGFSAFRYRSRGPAALVMAAAFLVLGLDFILIVNQAEFSWIIGTSIVLVALLVTEFALRSARQHNEGKK